MKYVSELYTTENLKETKYYKKVLDTLEYLDLVSPYEKDKQEVKKEFRDITSYMIIPKNLYEENSEEINKNLEILKQENISKKEKLTSKMKIRDLTLNIQGYELKTKNIGLNFIELGKYEKIYILDCDYSFEIGFIPNTTEEASKLIDERFL